MYWPNVKFANAPKFRKSATSSFICPQYITMSNNEKKTVGRDSKAIITACKNLSLDNVTQH